MSTLDVVRPMADEDIGLGSGYIDEKVAVSIKNISRKSTVGKDWQASHERNETTMTAGENATYHVPSFEDHCRRFESR